MSGRRAHSQERGSQDPRIVNVSPRIVTVAPEEGPRLPSAEGKRTVYSVRSPFSGRPYEVVKETKYKTKQTASDGEPSSLKSTTRFGRSTLPPEPPLVHQARPRSVSPTARLNRMPGQEQSEYVPLPEKIPTEAEKQEFLRRQREQRERERGRESRQSSRQSPASEPETRSFSRQRRPYSGITTSNPMSADQERVESNSPRHFEFVTPNEPIRSRNRAGDRPKSSTLDPTEVVRTKEYIAMREQGERYRAQAEKNQEAASEAVRRSDAIEDQLKKVTQQLSEVRFRESQAYEYSDALKEKVNRLQNQLDDCKHQIDTLKFENKKLERERERLEEQRKEYKARKGSDKGRSRNETDSSPSAAEGSSRQSPRKVIVRQPSSDEEPRTKPAIPRSSTTRYVVDDDMGNAAIAAARADAAREKAKTRR